MRQGFAWPPPLQPVNLAIQSPHFFRTREAGVGLGGSFSASGRPRAGRAEGKGHGRQGLSGVVTNKVSRPGLIPPWGSAALPWGGCWGAGQLGPGRERPRGL